MADEADTTLESADAAAEAMARQGRESLRPEVDPAREVALDDAFAASQGKAPESGQNPDNFGRENGGVRLPIEGAPSEAERAAQKEAEEKAQKEAEEKAAAEAAAKEAAKSQTPGAKGLLDDLVVEKPAAPEPPKDPYGDVKLRSDASPKTRETFENLKTLAKQREETLQKELEGTKQTLSELQAKVGELEKRTVPDEVQNELKELRAFRAQFDTANDPEFRQKFDTRISANYDAIYGKLKEHGLPEAEIAKLKSFSAADRDSAIEGFLDKLPTLSRKYIEAKLLGNVNVVEEREQALREARSKADEILAKRKEEPVKQASQRIDEIVKLVQPELAKLSWLHAKEIPSNAAPEERKRLEADNQAALSLQEALKTAIVDDSPATRARSALAVPLARHYSRLYVQERERAEGLQKQLDAVKAASATARTARSSAPTTAAAPAPAATPADGGDALDSLFAQSTGRTLR